VPDQVIVPGGPPIVFEPMAGLDARDLERAKAIYEDGFPLHQRMDFDEIVDSALDGSRNVIVAKAAGEVIGVSVVYPLSSAPALFLEYFAVDRARRGRGIGTRLWRHIMEPAPTGAPAEGFVLEVDDPEEEDLASEETRTRRRRMDFYLRLGARFLPIADYRVPFVTGEGEERLRLMWAPVREISPGSLRDLVLAVYEEGYELSRDDPLVVAALDSLS
jgi:GNAT superfamily N-acetyltransferase